MLILFETHPIVSISLSDKAQTLFVDEFEEIFKYN